MTVFPGPTIEPQVTIHPWSLESIGLGLVAVALPMSSAATVAWGTANYAVYIPFYIYVPTTIVKAGVWNGTAVAGNLDVGIYTSEGNKLVSSGAVAQAGTSSIQELDLTDTLLLPGLYFMAMSMSSTGNVFQVGFSVSGTASALGVLGQSTAHPLPATATFAKPTATGQGLQLPGFFLTTRTLI